MFLTISCDFQVIEHIGRGTTRFDLFQFFIEGRYDVFKLTFKVFFYCIKIFSLELGVHFLFFLIFFVSFLVFFRFFSEMALLQEE